MTPCSKSYNRFLSLMHSQQAGVQEKNVVLDHDVDAQDEKGDFGDEEDGEMVTNFPLQHLLALAFATSNDTLHRFEFRICLQTLAGML